MGKTLSGKIRLRSYNGLNRDYNAVFLTNEDVSSGGGSVTVVDNLTSDSATSALSAKQGKALKTEITSVETDLANIPIMADSQTPATVEVIDIESTLIGLRGTAATSLTGGKIKGGMRYNITLTNAGDNLTISEIEESVYETIIYLSIGANVTNPVTLPSTYKSIGVIGFEAGKNYIISVLNGIMVSGEITTNS